jgi:glycosyltransferase involved in cell wall biosynthesis
MRVLFVSHTGRRGGAEGVLVRLLGALGDDVQPAVACPAGGELASSVSALGVEVMPIRGTSLNMRLEPRQLAGGGGELILSAAGLGRASRRFRPDVVHANTLRAGLIAALPRMTNGVPLLVQSHEHLGLGRASRVSREVISRTADHVIAVTDATADDFNAGLARPLAERVYIGIDDARFRPPRRTREEILARLPVGVGGGPMLGQVAQITPWKGQDVTIRAFGRVREQFPGAQLLLVGSISFEGTRYDNRAFDESLKRLVADLGLGGCVHFLGQRDDVPELMSALDLHLMPSWDEPFGTATAEAMAVGTVPMVTAVGGMREYVEDGVSGRVIPPRDAEQWAAAAIGLLRDRERLDAMAGQAIKVASQFTMAEYATAVRSHWQQAIAHSRLERVPARLRGVPR